MSGQVLRDAYPLAWPVLQPRTPAHLRRDSHFKVSLVVARDELLAELRRHGARAIVLSTNVPTRLDGILYANAREPDDPGVAVYFERRSAAGTAVPVRWSPFVIACDGYSKLRWNLRAVWATLESLRTIQRHGSTTLLEQAFTGFAALPPAGGSSASARPWWVVLEVEEHAPPAVVREAFYRLTKLWHPDVPGGDAARMAEINAAFTASRSQ